MANEEIRPILTGGENLREEVEHSFGPGGKYHPWTFEEAAEHLAPQVERTEREVEALPRQLRGTRVIIEATLLPNYLAATYFPTPLLEATGFESVGSRSTTGVYRTSTMEEVRATKALLLSGTEESLSRLRQILSSEGVPATRAVQDAVFELSEVSLPREDRIVRNDPDADGSSPLATWEAVLHRVAGHSADEVANEQEEIFEKWRAWVEELGGEVVTRYRRVVGGLTFVPVHLPPSNASGAARFNPLRVLRPMPQLRPISPAPYRALAGPRPTARNGQARPRSEQRVAVFDGGVDPTCPFISPFVTYSELTAEPAVSDGIQHGSAVTNAVLYGYHEGTTQVDLPNVFVDHFRILPVPAGEEHDYELNWILDRIKETVQSGRYRMVNLSIGPDLGVEDDGEPSRWTAELDLLAQEEEVLFVCAAGNNGRNAPGLDRVQVPGDMVNGLAVGASDTRSSVTTFGRAEYSAKGPGRWGARVQPVGLGFGGDGLGNPFIAIGPKGERMETQGTSFSAPLVLHGLTDLVVGLGPEKSFRPHLMKAFAVHFSHRRTRYHSMDEFGFGLLREDYQSVLDCPQNEVTLIYDATLSRQGTTGFTLPLPVGLEPDRMVRIRWTLCYTSPVDPAEALEYTQAGVTATFRPHMRKIPVNGPDGTRIGVFDYLEQREEFEAAIAAGGTPSKNPASGQGREIRIDEQRQRDAGKWETVLHHRFGRRVSGLHFPRLDLSYFAREGGVLVNSGAVDDLPISLLVTLESADPSLYEMVRQQFQILVPIPVEIEI